MELFRGSYSSTRSARLTRSALRRSGLFDLYLRLKYRDIVKMLEKDGWRLISQEGSHRQFKHPVKTGRVTVAGHPAKDAALGTLNSILKHAGLKR